MTKELKQLLWWSFFISVFAVIYAVIYTALPIPAPVLWCSYVSLPIFFTGGGKLKDIPSLSICAVCGFLWGIVCLWIMGMTSSMNSFVSLSIGVFISVMLCCAIHMGFLSKTIFGKCPMAFGGFACCFATGGTNGITVCGTLIAGLLLGGIMAYSGKWADKLAGIENA